MITNLDFGKIILLLWPWSLGESFTYSAIPRDCVFGSCGGDALLEIVGLDSDRDVLPLGDGKDICSTQRQFAVSLLYLGRRSGVQIHEGAFVGAGVLGTHVFGNWDGFALRNLQELIKLYRGFEIIRFSDKEPIYIKTLMNDKVCDYKQIPLFSLRKWKYLTEVKRLKRSKLSVPYYSNSVATNRIILQDGDVEVNPGPNGLNSIDENGNCPKERPTNNNIQSIVTQRYNVCFNNQYQHRNLENLTFIPCLNDNKPKALTSLCLLNAQSVRNKSAALYDYFCDCKADLYAITETWLNVNDDAVRAELCPPGYRLVDQSRTSRPGGGTALLYRDFLSVTKVDGGEKESFEYSEWIVQFTSSQYMRIIVLYRTPYSEKHKVTISTFFTEFSNYLETVVMSKEPLLILGDFNIHVDVAENLDSIKFLDMLESVGLQQHVKHPTHVGGHTLDLIITRQIDRIISVEPRADQFLSDHSSTLCFLQFEKPRITLKAVTYRKWKSVNIENLNRELKESELCKNPPEDLDNLVACYQETLKTALDKHAPLRTKTVNARSCVPWFNDKIREAKRHRRKAEKKWRTSKLDIDFVVFKRKRNEATNLMKQARREFYANLIEENKDNQGKLFKICKQLFNHSNVPTFPPNIDNASFANGIGNYFVQKIARIRRNLDDVDSCNNDSPVLGQIGHVQDTPLINEFKELSTSDVAALIKSSTLKTCALDPMPSILVSRCDALIPIITQIINTSLQLGSFPAEWKEALVLPLLKKCGLQLIFKNFRPVSNLLFVSKLTERAVFDQMHVHMSINNLYPSAQSSYRKHHSVETALLKIKNDLLLNMNKQHVTLLVLLDLSAAFDTVDHPIMLERLQTKLGVSGIVRDWFCSYLSGRSQRISINGSLSDKFDLDCGVPQGSCLGPLLFSIYVSKLFDIIERHLPTAHSYADDSQLYVSFSPKEDNGQSDAIIAMERCVADIRQWLTEDKLFMNDDKTEFIVIGTKQQLSKIDIGSIKIGDVDIVPDSPIRNLGAWFESTLSMDRHTTKTSSTAFYYLYNIKRIRKFLSRADTETLIHAFISCRLDYCNSLLYGLPAYQLAKLQRVQNAAARLIFEETKFCHITPLLSTLHWLPIKYRIEFKVLLFTYKTIHGQAPIYLQELLTMKHSKRYNLRTNNSLMLDFPSARSYATLGDRAFVYAAPKLWNALPGSLRMSASIDIFKKSLKTFLFKKAFA